MKRKTSIDAYNKIKNNGLLGRLQFSVYSKLYESGPLTANELRTAYNHDGNSGVYTTRLSELERRGCVYVVERRKCKITGNMALSWDVTDGLPVKITKRPTRKQKIKQILLDLRNLYAECSDSNIKNKICLIGEKLKEV